jgi:hypothetical protein
LLKQTSALVFFHLEQALSPTIYGVFIRRQIMAGKGDPFTEIDAMIVDSALKMLCLPQENLENANLTVSETGDQNFLVTTKLSTGSLFYFVSNCKGVPQDLQYILIPDNTRGQIRILCVPIDIGLTFSLVIIS